MTQSLEGNGTGDVLLVAAELGTLIQVRRFIRQRLVDADPESVADVVQAVDEIVSNVVEQDAAPQPYASRRRTSRT
jgi:hypothetical protein